MGSGGVRAEVSLTREDLQTLQSRAENSLRPGHHFVLKEVMNGPDQEGQPVKAEEGEVSP